MHSYKKEITEWLLHAKWQIPGNIQINLKKVCLQEIYDLEKEIKKQMIILQCKKCCNEKKCEHD